MPVKNYGVWRGTPMSYHAQSAQEDPRSPHVTIKFTDGSNQTKEAPVNVKSISSDSRLVYWVDRDFRHPLTDSLRELSNGFHWIPDRDQSNAGLALDYQRADPPVLKFSDGLLLEHDIPGPKNDILDELLPTLDRAIQGGSNTVFIFGSSYRTGIHDIHMNQGSLAKFDNGVGQDGALVFHFAEDDHFEAVFLAFATQTVPTDDETGLGIEGSQPLSQIARSLPVRSKL